MAGVAHYDMVKHFDFEKLPGAYQVARYLNVGFGRRCLPARVIVREHEGGGGGHDRQPEYFTRVNQDCVLGANANQIMAFDAAAGIQHQDNEAFTLRAEIRVRGNVQTPVIGNLLRRVAKCQTLRRRAFPERSHLVFVGLRREREGFHNLETR